MIPIDSITPKCFENILMQEEMSDWSLYLNYFGLQMIRDACSRPTMDF